MSAHDTVDSASLPSSLALSTASSLDLLIIEGAANSVYGEPSSRVSSPLLGEAMGVSHALAPTPKPVVRKRRGALRLLKQMGARFAYFLMSCCCCCRPDPQMYDNGEEQDPFLPHRRSPDRDSERLGPASGSQSPGERTCPSVVKKEQIFDPRHGLTNTWKGSYEEVTPVSTFSLNSI